MKDLNIVVSSEPMGTVRKLQDSVAENAGLLAMLAFRDDQIKQLKNENARQEKEIVALKLDLGQTKGVLICKEQKIKDLLAQCASKSLAFLNLQDKLQAASEQGRTLVLALSSMEADTRLIGVSLCNDSETQMEEWRRAEFDRLMREFEVLAPPEPPVRAETPPPQDEMAPAESPVRSDTPPPQDEGDELVKRQLKEFAERTAAYQKQQAEDQLKAQQEREAAELKALEEQKAEKERVARQEAARKEAEKLAKEAKKQELEESRRKREVKRLKKGERKAQRQAKTAEPAAEPEDAFVPDTWEEPDPALPDENQRVADSSAPAHDQQLRELDAILEQAALSHDQQLKELDAILEQADADVHAARERQQERFREAKALEEELDAVIKRADAYVQERQKERVTETIEKLQAKKARKKADQKLAAVKAKQLAEEKAAEEEASRKQAEDESMAKTKAADQPPEQKVRDLPGYDKLEAREIAVTLLVTEKRRAMKAEKVKKFMDAVKAVFEKTDNHDFKMTSSDPLKTMFLGVYASQCIGMQAYQVEQNWRDRSKFRLSATITMEGMLAHHKSPWVTAANIVFWLNEPTFVDACRKFFGFVPGPNDDPVLREMIMAHFAEIKSDKAFRALKLRSVDETDNLNIPLQQITVSTGETVVGPMLLMMLWFYMGKISYLADV